MGREKSLLYFFIERKMCLDMITKAGNSSEHINHFRGLSADVTANKHIPGVDGKLDGTVVGNGDELYCMDTGDTYLYDLENKVWIPQ